MTQKGLNMQLNELKHGMVVVLGSGEQYVVNKNGIAPDGLHAKNSISYLCEYNEDMTAKVKRINDIDDIMKVYNVATVTPMASRVVRIKAALKYKPLWERVVDIYPKYFLYDDMDVYIYQDRDTMYRIQKDAKLVKYKYPVPHGDFGREITKEETLKYLPVDAKIIVTSVNAQKYKMYYAGYDKNNESTCACFGDGTSSWNAPKGSISVWACDNFEIWLPEKDEK